MYFVYVDESGTKDPRIEGKDKLGQVIEKDWLYVLVGVSLFETKWFRFEHVINAQKLALLRRIRRDEQVLLELADTEIKSRWVRVPDERAQHPFLSRLTDDELKNLVDLYLLQPQYHAMRIFAVVVDKRYLLRLHDTGTPSQKGVRAPDRARGMLYCVRAPQPQGPDGS